MPMDAVEKWISAIKNYGPYALLISLPIGCRGARGVRPLERGS